MTTLPAGLILTEEITSYVADLLEIETLVKVCDVRAAMGRLHGVGRQEFDRAAREATRGAGFHLIAISDYRKATKEELADAIEGENETLFYFVER
jgi:hypothetical protein